MRLTDIKDPIDESQRESVREQREKPLCREHRALHSRPNEVDVEEGEKFLDQTVELEAAIEKKRGKHGRQHVSKEGGIRRTFRRDGEQFDDAPGRVSRVKFGANSQSKLKTRPEHGKEKETERSVRNFGSVGRSKERSDAEEETETHISGKKHVRRP